MTGATDNEFRRLRWRCRRGLLELDLVLQGFLERRYGQLEQQERDVFLRLLELPDRVLLACLNGETAPHPQFEQIIKKIV